MKWMTRILVTTLVSVVVAIGISMVSKLDEVSGVFKTQKAQHVSELNIVDVVSKMPLHLRIRRVEVTHAIVSIDLLATSNSEHGDVVKDLYEIPTSLFASSTNINQVLVRVLDGSKEQPNGGTNLLVATDARREKWVPGDPKARPGSTDELLQYLDSHFRMTYFPKWQERYGEKM
jgi:hypothetical protein